MTCREKLKLEHPECVERHRAGGCYGCPDHYGYLPRPKYCLEHGASSCIKCWDREIPGTEKTDNGDSRLIDELMRDNKDLRIELREAQTRCDEKDMRLDENNKTISNLQTKLKEIHMKLEEKERCLTENSKALLAIMERLQKYESNDERCNNISAKLSETHRKQVESKAKDYRMKFQALINQGFTEDQAMQFLPMWMDD